MDLDHPNEITYRRTEQKRTCVTDELNITGKKFHNRDRGREPQIESGDPLGDWLEGPLQLGTRHNTRVTDLIAIQLHWVMPSHEFSEG